MTKLTAKTVETIKPATTRQEIPDALLPGLYLVVQPSGARSWAVRYRHNGTPRKHTLGSYPTIDLKTARELGTKVLRTAAEGRDPAGEKQVQQANSVAEVVSQFLAKHGQRNYRPKTLKEAERLLRLNVISRWGNRPIASITRKEVDGMLDALVDDTPVLANRVHSITRKLFGWAVEKEVIPASPLAGLKAPAEEKSRERILTDQELRAVWQAADQVGPPYGALVKLLILTGQRRGEIAGLTWDEVDLEKRLVTLPAARTKNSCTHEVPLSPAAAALIEGLPRRSERYVFSLGGGPINGFGKDKTRIDKACGVEGWTLHDLRRTAASGMARLGVNLPVIEKILNHVSGSFAGVAGIYQRHDFAGEKRAALEKWADHVAALVTGKAAKVVTLR
jgi:integrase